MNASCSLLLGSTYGNQTEAGRAHLIVIITSTDWETPNFNKKKGLTFAKEHHQSEIKAKNKGCLLVWTIFAYLPLKFKTKESKKWISFYPLMCQIHIAHLVKKLSNAA